MALVQEMFLMAGPIQTGSSPIWQGKDTAAWTLIASVAVLAMAGQPRCMFRGGRDHSCRTGERSNLQQ